MIGNFGVLITCNSHLTVNSQGDRGAWRRRLVLINYDQRKQIKNIPHFGHLLAQEEGPGIVNWCVQGLQKVRADIKQYGELDLNGDQSARVDSLLDESDGLRLYLRNHIKASDEKNLTTLDIIKGYTAYCLSRGWTMSSDIIMRRLPHIMIDLFQAEHSTNIPTGTGKSRGYRNVTWRENDDED
jgi:hypothetical protein